DVRVRPSIATIAIVPRQKFFFVVDGFFFSEELFSRQFIRPLERRNRGEAPHSLQIRLTIGCARRRPFVLAGQRRNCRNCDEQDGSKKCSARHSCLREVVMKWTAADYSAPGQRPKQFCESVLDLYASGVIAPCLEIPGHDYAQPSSFDDHRRRG